MRFKYVCIKKIIVFGCLSAIFQPALPSPRREERKREAKLKELLSIKRKSDGIKKVLFSPGGKLEETFCTLIAHEKKEIRIAAYVLTLMCIVNALLAARKRGIMVSVVIDKEKCEGEAPRKLYDGGVDDVSVYKGKCMHHKFAVFRKNIFKRSLVWHGSANFTDCGFHRNEDSATVEDSIELVTQFSDQFGKIKERCIPLCEYKGCCRKQKKRSRLLKIFVGSQ